jgi:hypothetical protein
MRKQDCKHCGQGFGLNQLYSVFDEVLCQSCADKRLKDVPRKEVTPKTVYAMHDPTVCARCKADNGLDAYDLFLEVPICTPCRNHMKHYPFPLWIKAACVVIAVMVGFTIHMNLRFFKARIFLTQSMRLGFVDNQWEQASQGMEQVVTLIPESPDLKVLWHYTAGINELQSDHSQKAVDHLEQCNNLPEDYHVKTLLLDAQSGVVFNKKDYPEFLRISQQRQKLYPNDPMILAQVSSAYACIYAAEGRDEDKQKSLDTLRHAEQLYGNSIPEGFTEYKERILYRLETRQILTKKEYDLKKATKEK